MRKLLIYENTVGDPPPFPHVEPSLEGGLSVDGCGWDLVIRFGRDGNRMMKIGVRFCAPFPEITEVTLDGVAKENLVYDDQTARLTHRNQLQ